MTHFHDVLPTLTEEAIKVARAFTVGELEPRLMAGDGSSLHFLPMGTGGRMAPLALYLLVDVAMPNRYVRIPLMQGPGGALRLGAAELWRVTDGAAATVGGIVDDYVPLFEELNARLFA